VTIDIDANVFFTEGTDIPSTTEILNVMAAVNYMEYITDFVWNSEPIPGVCKMKSKHVAGKK
jgi:hypothetical protein